MDSAAASSARGKNGRQAIYSIHIEKYMAYLREKGFSPDYLDKNDEIRSLGVWGRNQHKMLEKPEWEKTPAELEHSKLLSAAGFKWVPNAAEHQRRLDSKWLFRLITHLRNYSGPRDAPVLGSKNPAEAKYATFLLSQYVNYVDGHMSDFRLSTLLNFGIFKKNADGKIELKWVSSPSHCSKARGRKFDSKKYSESALALAEYIRKNKATPDWKSKDKSEASLAQFSSQALSLLKWLGDARNSHKIALSDREKARMLSDAGISRELLSSAYRKRLRLDWLSCLDSILKTANARLWSPRAQTRWWEKQAALHESGKLGKWKRWKLKKAGVPLNSWDWQLKRYFWLRKLCKAEPGNKQAADAFATASSWLKTQVAYSKSGLLDAEKSKKLIGTGALFARKSGTNKHELNFQQDLALFKRFKSGEKISSNMLSRVKHWQNFQRNLYFRGTLKPERKEALWNAGFAFTYWEDKLDEIASFKEKTGHYPRMRTNSKRNARLKITEYENSLSYSLFNIGDSLGSMQLETFNPKNILRFVRLGLLPESSLAYLEQGKQ